MSSTSLLVGIVTFSLLTTLYSKMRVSRNRQWARNMPKLPNNPKLTELGVGLAKLPSEVLAQVMEQWPEETRLQAGLHLAAAARLKQQQQQQQQQTALENISRLLGTNPAQLTHTVSADPAKAAKRWADHYF